MKTVIQRVTHASVEMDGDVIARIDAGLLVLLGVAKEDSESDAQYIVDKLIGLRIFSDTDGKMNRSIVDIGGQILIVSQFTLLGDTAKGRRPGFDRAATPERALNLYEQVIGMVRNRGIHVETGRFGAHMRVSLENDGPVTFLLDSGTDRIEKGQVSLP
ncbi:MAG TPA: D-aminoacyl-tRNA deacylase [Nitrospiraceae bacterium]|nr:D-aminoacyl-tRNA deacylase [Nitrospiraceae bacterium]